MRERDEPLDWELCDDGEEELLDLVEPLGCELRDVLLLHSCFLTANNFFWASFFESFPALTAAAISLSVARYLARRGSCFPSSFLSSPPRLAASMRLRSPSSHLDASSLLILPLLTPASMRLRMASMSAPPRSPPRCGSGRAFLFPPRPRSWASLEITAMLVAINNTENILFFIFNCRLPNSRILRL